MIPALDPRLTPARPDLAAAHLLGQVEAPRYVEGRAARIVAPSAPLRRRPDAEAPLETEALHGESVMVYDESNGWAWVQLDRDAYVGYLPGAALGEPAEPTHRVAALRTHAYPGPSIKLPPRMALSLGAELTIVGVEGDFAVSADGLHLWARHLAETDSFEPDYVAVAERFLETPYLWGGRTSEGIDCSGLVQTALAAAGLAVAARQRHAGGRAGRAGRQRRAAQARRSRVLEGPRRHHARSAALLHANGWHMKVVSEPLTEARDRIAASGGGKVTSVRRLREPLRPAAGEGRGEGKRQRRTSAHPSSGASRHLLPASGGGRRLTSCRRRRGRRSGC